MKRFRMIDGGKKGRVFPCQAARMHSLAHSIADIAYIDTLAAGDTPLHRLDARSKLLATAAFIVVVVSFDKHTISGLIPFAIYPVVLIASGGLPAGYVFKKVLLVLPLVLAIGAANLFTDRDILLRIGSLPVSGGWVSFFSILLRSLLTMTALLAFVCVTGVVAIGAALTNVGLPRLFVNQLVLFHRYLFVLIAEAERLVRAQTLRACDTAAPSVKTFVRLLGSLLLRTLDRAERIYRAMEARGFDGHMRTLDARAIRGPDIMFAGGWIILFAVLRMVNVPQMLGAVLQGVSP